MTAEWEAFEPKGGSVLGVGVCEEMLSHYLSAVSLLNMCCQPRLGGLCPTQCMCGGVSCMCVIPRSVRTYGKTLIQPFQPAVSVSHSYGKMVPPTTPYGKTIPLEHWGVGGTV